MAFPKAFSSKGAICSRQEDASKQKYRSPVPIASEKALARGEILGNRGIAARRLFGLTDLLANRAARQGHLQMPPERFSSEAERGSRKGNARKTRNESFDWIPSDRSRLWSKARGGAFDARLARR
jgi:hypothetical protein